jgi:copper resistance protein D
VTLEMASVLLRSLCFITLFQAAGAGLFILCFDRLLESSAATIRCLSLRSAIAALALLSVHYALEAGRLSGTWHGILDPELQNLVWDSPARVVWIARMLGMVLIAIGACSARRFARASVATGVVLLAVSFAGVGHTAAPGASMSLAVLLVAHVAVAAFWFGSLLPLLTVTRCEQMSQAACIVEGFSRWAVRVVPGLLIAGVLLAWNLIPGWSSFAQPYGMLLLAKLLGFAVLMVLAALNRWRYGPRLVAEAAAVRALRRSIAAEYSIICLILSATAVLTTFYSPEQ